MTSNEFRPILMRRLLIMNSLFYRMSTEIKSRRPNFTQAEILALATTVEEHKDVLFGKFDNEGVSGKSKKDIWKTVRDAVNAVGGNNRTVDEIKTKNKNLKTETKKVVSANVREMKKTGGGKATIVALSDAQEKVLATIPTESIHGIDGGIDLYEKKPKSKFMS